MQQTTTTMLTRADEEDLIEDIREGIGIALTIRGSSSDSIDSIKLNKLVYLAVDRLDIPLTFGWYKYGPAPVEIKYTETAAKAKPKEECDAPYDSRLPKGDFYSPMEYAYFFEDELDNFSTILQASTKEFLISFYKREDPKPYTELYVKNAQLQQAIDEIKEDVSWHEDAEVYYQEVSQRLGQLNRELSKIGTLRDVRKPLRDYTRFLKSLLAHASDIDQISAKQQRYIKRIIEYYYGGAWKYVALNISKDTVHLSPGDNDHKLLTSIENDLQELRANYNDDLYSFRERAKDLELYEAYSNREGSIDNSEDGIKGQNDAQYSDLWAQASFKALAKNVSSIESEQ